MAEAYIGEIRMFGGNFAPVGWSFCDGSLLAIAQYDALFALIGTTYGGDGQNTFALPDLRGRVPVHQGQGAGLSNYTIGQNGGSETVTLITNQLPSHAHSAQAQSGQGGQASPSGGVWASSNLSQFSNNPANSAMSPQAMTLSGGSQPHENMLPFECISFIICLEGIFPSQG